jgi:hypothetical protein
MKEKKLNAKDVQERVGELFSNHKHIFLNRYIFGRDWESDFFSVTNTGYCYEVEVKISKSDYKVDFDKFKHKLFEGRKDAQVIKEAKYRYSKRWKKNVRMAPEKNINPQTAKMPNRFFFACPEGLISKEEIPEYAGLIYVSDSGYTRVIKQAPILHKRKFDIKELLFSKYQWGYINATEDLKTIKNKHTSLEKKFDVMCRGLEKQFKLKEGSVTSLTVFKKLLSETK